MGVVHFGQSPQCPIAIVQLIIDLGIVVKGKDTIVVVSARGVVSVQHIITIDGCFDLTITH